MSHGASRRGRLYLCRVLGLHVAVPTGLMTGVALRLVTSDQFVVPTIRFPVAPQQVAAAILCLGAGWVLVDEWPCIVRTTRQRTAAIAGLRWAATQAVCVGSAAIAVAGVPHFDAVPLASLMCSFAALVSVAVRQAWWTAPLLVGYVVLRVNGVVDPSNPVARDVLIPVLVGLVSAAAYVGGGVLRSTPR